MQLLVLGQTPYQQAWDIQREIFRSVIEGGEDTLILVEHPHVYTFGRGADMANFLLSDEKLREIGAEKFEIERGGDVTYHGPGQLVGYPILNLSHFKEDLGWYLRALEETIIKLLATYEIEGFRVPGRTGVWVKAQWMIDHPRGSEEKICAIGIRTSRWCTMHGFAFNVSTDLTYFDHIVPCGIADRGVTSLEKLLSRKIPMDEVIGRYVNEFESVFDVKIEESILQK